MRRLALVATCAAAFQLGPARRRARSVLRAAPPSAAETPPVIDIGALVSADGADAAAAAAAVDAIDAACRTWGFFQVVNHGIDAGLIDAFEAEMVHFFKLPADVKRAVKRTATNSRGFADDELTKQLRDLKELYDCLLYTSPSPRDRG